MKLSLAVLCLLAPQGEAVIIKNKLMSKINTEFPTLPSGQSVTNVMTGLLEQGEKLLPELMFKQERWCRKRADTKNDMKNGGDCIEYDRGVRKTIERTNEDFIHTMERAGIDFTKNVYDPKFITDLIQAEYSDFVAQVKQHNGEISAAVQQGFDQITKSATQLGLAQIQEPLDKPGNVVAPTGGFEDCYNNPKYDQRCEKGASWSDPEGCPGPCCWDSQPTKEQQKLQDQWYDDKDSERFQCFARADFVQAIFGKNIQPITTEQAVQIVSSIRKLLGDSKAKQELANIVHFVNDELRSEAKRLGVTTPSLPNPEDTVDKLAKALLAMLAEEESRGADRLYKQVQESQYQTLKEVWRAGADLRRNMDGLKLETFNPQAAVQQLQKVKQMEIDSGKSDREFGQAAQAINSLGGNTTNEEVKQFASDSIDTVVNILSNPKLEQKIEGAAQQAQNVVA